MSDIPTLRRILKENRVIAVVGLSANWYRPSYFAAKYMLDHGYHVIPVNPSYQEVLGQKCYPSLRDVPESVDHVIVGVPWRLLPAVLADAEANRSGALNIVSSGFAGTGIRAVPLGTEEIIELLYRSFNPGELENPIRLDN